MTVLVLRLGSLRLPTRFDRTGGAHFVFLELALCCGMIGHERGRRREGQRGTGGKGSGGAGPVRDCSGVISSSQASFSYTCPAKQAEWWALEPNFLPMSASASAYDSISQQALQIHVSNFHSSCTGRRPHLEPCVPQSPAHAGPAGTQGNSFVKCKYSGPGGQVGCLVLAPDGPQGFCLACAAT